MGAYKQANATKINTNDSIDDKIDSDISKRALAHGKVVTNEYDHKDDDYAHDMHGGMSAVEIEAAVLAAEAVLEASGNATDQGTSNHPDAAEESTDDVGELASEISNIIDSAFDTSFGDVTTGFYSKAGL